MYPYEILRDFLRSSYDFDEINHEIVHIRHKDSSAYCCAIDLHEREGSYYFDKATLEYSIFGRLNLTESKKNELFSKLKDKALKWPKIQP